MSFKEKKLFGEQKTLDKTGEKIQYKITDISNKLLEVSTKNQFFG